MIHRTLTIACVGDQSCGKSSLLRCIAQKFQGVEEDSSYLFDKEEVEVGIDSTFSSLVTFKNTSGKEDLEAIRKTAIEGADGALVCFSLVDAGSLDRLAKKWVPEIKSILGSDIPFIIVGLKSDAKSALEVSPSDSSKHVSRKLIPVPSKEGEALVKKTKASGYFEVSASTGDNVKDAIVELLKAATIHKIRQDKLQRNSGSYSPVSSTSKSGLFSRILPNRISTKARLSQRLFEVAAQGETAEALELISKGAHVSWSSVETKSSPLHAAAKAGKVDVVNVLLYAKADINMKDGNGATPLHVACANGYFDCAKALLDRGADANARNLAESTPLHDAAGFGSRELVMLLLERGADESLKDIGGHTARERAGIAGYPMLFEVDSNDDTIPELDETKSTKEQQEA